MIKQKTENFERIRQAIEFIDANYESQPSLEEIAQHIHLSPFHFQRLFKDWAGVSPKQFLQYINTEHAKKLLTENNLSLFDTSHQLGLSSTSRLHDMFIKIEGMTPAEYKNGGENLSINYFVYESLFGKVLIASTVKGICKIAFTDNEEEAIKELKQSFPNAHYFHVSDVIQKNAIKALEYNKKAEPIAIHLKGTDFQIKVWEALLKIPMGKLTTYGEIASYIENEKACRAVGTAVGNNPVAVLIPCHRVIRSTGVFGDYRWGPLRKKALIGFESAHVSS